MRKPTAVPPASVLKMLEKEERARLLLGIAKRLKKGMRPKNGDKGVVKGLLSHWPGMG